jgi:hypothetical protein
MYERLDDSNFILYAARHYDNPHCFDDEEFFDDLKRFKYLKKLFKKYRDSGVLRERLILNHVIVIYNLFGPEPATRMLFSKMDGYYPELKACLLFLNYMPPKVYNVGPENSTVSSADVVVDGRMLESLRSI